MIADSFPASFVLGFSALSPLDVLLAVAKDGSGVLEWGGEPPDITVETRVLIMM